MALLILEGLMGGYQRTSTCHNWGLGLAKHNDITKVNTIKASTLCKKEAGLQCVSGCYMIINN